MADRGGGHRDGGRPAPRARRARMGAPARAGERRGRQGARGDSARLPRRDGGGGGCVRLTFRRAHHRAPAAVDRAPGVRRVRRLARTRDAAPAAGDVPTRCRGRRLGAPPARRADHDPRGRGRRAFHRPTRAPAAQRVGGDLRDDLRGRRGRVPARRRARAPAGGARHRRGRRPRAGHGHPGGVARDAGTLAVRPTDTLRGSARGLARRRRRRRGLVSRHRRQDLAERVAPDVLESLHHGRRATPRHAVARRRPTGGRDHPRRRRCS